MNNDQSKLVSCCELLTLFERYYQKKFGIDGIILFTGDFDNESFPVIWEITVSLFNYFEKKDKLCEKCKQNWRKLKGD